MQVIGVGFGRTGTLSLKVALEQLGFGPCYHMFEVIDSPRRTRDWIRAADAPPDTIDWAGMLAGYRSTVDWPGAALWRPLVAAYPQAKVVLTVRDPDRWYDSAASTIFRDRMRVTSLLGRARLWLSLRTDPAMRQVVPMVSRLVWDGVFGGRFADRTSAIERFHRHVAEVRAEVPADRLLVYEVSSGWGPLCDFLGVDAPARPFPRANDQRTFHEWERGQLAGALAAPLALAARTLSDAARSVRTALVDRSVSKG